MDRKDVDTAVAENIHLRGLFGVAGGLLAIFAALRNEEQWPFVSDWVFLPAVAVLALAAWGVSRYYNRRFGRSTPPRGYERRMVLALVVGVPAVIVGSLFLSSRASWSLDLPVNTTAISLGLVLLISFAATVGLRRHHVVIYGALLLVGAIPVWERGGMSGNTGMYLAGAAMVLGGLLDHRLLVRRFGARASDREDDRAGAH
jgi:hypothetical protein